jgi:hypothetical protein
MEKKEQAHMTYSFRDCDLDAAASRVLEVRTRLSGEVAKGEDRIQRSIVPRHNFVQPFSYTTTHMLTFDSLKVRMLNGCH